MQTALFVSLLGGAACAAISCDFRSVFHIRFREFMVVNRAYFQIQGFIFRLRLYFKWAIPISGFATTTRANNTRSRCAIAWLPTSTSGGYSAAPLPSSPETGLTSHCESDKLSLLSLVQMTLTRNNHCERGSRNLSHLSDLWSLTLSLVSAAATFNGVTQLSDQTHYRPPSGRQNLRDTGRSMNKTAGMINVWSHGSMIDACGQCVAEGLFVCMYSLLPCLGPTGVVLELVFFLCNWDHWRLHTYPPPP